MTGPVARGRPRKIPEKYHPLFPPKDNEAELEGKERTPYDGEIHRIMILRHDADKLRAALRDYGPEEIRDLTTLFSLYGGGVYELAAKDEQNVIRRRIRYSLDGPSRSLNGDDVKGPEAPKTAAQAIAQAAPPTDTMGAFVHLLGTIVTASMQQTGAIVAALVAGKNSAPAVDPMAGLAAMTEALAKFQTASHPPPVVAAPQQSGTAQLKETLEVVKLAQELGPKEKEETVSEQVTAIGGLVAPIVQSLLSRAPIAPAPVG